ncbi:MAG: HAD family hydrolase [Kiritimatiellae bacterium]|nr:HAD family hydrolase [Kiritimatiellia bacterium]MDD5522343.1 HAD family hydrolase [Kiritimatiellia bacterium]
MKKCVFFDRDGIVNKSPGAGYVERWADFHLLPEFPDILRVVQQKGYEAVIVTNQRGVARGLMTVETLEEIHENFKKLMAEKYNLVPLDILYCVHDKGQCECRKPKPGMLVEAAKRHNLDLKMSWMVGDHETDIEAGRRAGCKTILVSGNKPEMQADYVVPDLKSLESLLKNVLEDHKVKIEKKRTKIENK